MENVSRKMSASRFSRLQSCAPVDSVSGECFRQFKHERGIAQRFGHLADGLLWLHRMLVTQRDFVLSESDRRGQDGPVRLVLPHHRGVGAAQQLHQSFYLRRQVS